MPSHPRLGFNSILGILDSQFLYGTGGTQVDPPSNPVQSPAVNSGLVSDLTGVGSQPSGSSANTPGVGETLNIPSSGGANYPQQDGASQTQNLLRPLL